MAASAALAEGQGAHTSPPTLSLPGISHKGSFSTAQHPELCRAPSPEPVPRADRTRFPKTPSLLPVQTWFVLCPLSGWVRLPGN